ncbi:hypothetical protein ACFE04_021182 [Oxalis oulophora]
MVFPKLLRACQSIARTNQQADIGAYPKTDGSDEKYILTDDQDDLVQVWSMDDLKVVAWGDRHNSSVSGVTSDSHWSVSNSDGNEELVLYWFVDVDNLPGTVLQGYQSPFEVLHAYFQIPMQKFGLGGIFHAVVQVCCIRRQCNNFFYIRSCQCDDDIHIISDKGCGGMVMD